MSRGASESVKYLDAANPKKEVAIKYGINALVLERYRKRLLFSKLL